VEWPLRHVEVYRHLGVDPPRGILLHGPPGCGKSMLADAIAGELGVPYFRLAATEVVSGMSGESEKKLREMFAEAKECAPSLIFLDEIDAITSKREFANKDMERRIVTQLLACMDDISLEATGGKPVIVLGATNRPDSLDSALRRAGRFDRELEMGAPDQPARKLILQALSSRLRLSGDIDFETLSRKTAGYVGADLAALTTTAATSSVHRIGTTVLSKRDEGHEMEMDGDETKDRSSKPLSEAELESLSITMEDFLTALDKVQPSSLREGFTTVPDVSWSDIGALSEIRQELMMAVVEPVRDPERFSRLGLSSPAGVLLYGPPGCGKTLLAKATARESGANFISVKGPELLNKFVGESERSVRKVFQRARASAPCIVFFDELDALAPRRGNSDSSSSERVVNQLLTELDGITTRKQVFVIAATNRPDIIDPAMLRPGRLDKLLYVPLPSETERVSILKAASKNTPLHEGIDLEAIAKSSSCDGFSGADLAALVREAAVDALRQESPASTEKLLVQAVNFDSALKRIFPSVSTRDAKLYRDLQHKIKNSRGHIEPM